jgi:alkyl sulfatase BDS1-like metallo-beta-lactamase superfamily hydrolase
MIVRQAPSADNKRIVAAFLFTDEHAEYLVELRHSTLVYEKVGRSEGADAVKLRELLDLLDDFDFFFPIVEP